MKKFDRLPPEKRKEEIKTAAARLFAEKGFSATTMENIVSSVSLSKGGVYRIYPSTAAILSDLMLDGMHLRNAFYAQRAKQTIAEGGRMDLPQMIDMVCDSLLLYPEISAVYVEFLWEKRRNPDLEQLYCRLCTETVSETLQLMQQYGADAAFGKDGLSMELLTELMNAAILAIQVLNLRKPFAENKDMIAAVIGTLMRSSKNTQGNAENQCKSELF